MPFGSIGQCSLVLSFGFVSVKICVMSNAKSGSSYVLGELLFQKSNCVISGDAGIMELILGVSNGA